MSKLKKTILANNFLDLTEVKLIGKKHDSVGILSVIKTYFAMSESSDGFLDKEEILMIAEGWGVEDAEAWLSLCLLKNIFTEKSGRYFNTHVQKDRENYRKKLEYDRNRKGNGNDSLENKEGKINDPDTDSVYDPRSNKNGRTHILTVPESLHCDEIIKAVANWQKKLLTQGRFLNQLTLDAQLMGLGLDKKRILAAIEYSCSRTQCLNLIEPPEKEQKTNGYHKQDPPRPVSASESKHPALVAQRQRETNQHEKKLLEKVGLGK